MNKWYMHKPCCLRFHQLFWELSVIGQILVQIKNLIYQKGSKIQSYAYLVLVMYGVDLLAGVEAIISHLIVEEFKIPAAHATINLSFPPSASLSPKSAVEEINALLP
jgi:Protein of unknown function (DUF3326)